jgi:acetate kinase
MKSLVRNSGSSSLQFSLFQAREEVLLAPKGTRRMSANPHANGD